MRSRAPRARALGTALFLGEAAAEGRGQPLEALRLPPHTVASGVRRPGGIGFASLRGGSSAGEHRVMLAGEGERIEITHKSSSRATYAQGSLRAVRFLSGKTHGLYDMFDVLGLK